MGKKASNYLPTFATLFCILLCIGSEAFALSAFDSELGDALQKKDWPSVVLLLQPKKGQNFEHDLTLAKALLSLERRQEALKLLVSLQETHKDERLNRMLQSAGTIFFYQETSNLYYESLELIRAFKFQEAKDRLEQGLAKEPFQVLLLTRLIQMELVLGQKDQAAANLKSAQSVTTGLMELKLFAVKLLADAQIAETLAQEAVLASASPAPPEEEIDLELYQELSPLKLQLLENEVTFPYWLEALKKAQKHAEIEAQAIKVLKDRPTWTYVLMWLNQNANLNSELKSKVHSQIEKNLKNREAFDQALNLEMKKTDYLWVGYINFETMLATWTSLQPKSATPSPSQNICKMRQ